MDNAVKIFQILFYSIGSTVAILTYIKAKKGLLNSINTEFQKTALKKVEEISEYLISEFDQNSENYWGKKMCEVDTAKQMIEYYKENKDYLKKEGRWFGGIQSNTSIERLDNWVNKVKSDPFVPKYIRNIVVHKLKTRIDKANRIEIEEFEKFGQKLIESGDSDDINNWPFAIHNRINDRLYKEGIGISQIEETIHEIRTKIQSYYEQYDPFK